MTDNLIDAVLQSPAWDEAVVTRLTELLSPTSQKRLGTVIRLCDVTLTQEDALQEAKTLALTHHIDFALVRAGLRLGDFAALFFDMDSTLATSETLDEMAAIHGVGEACKAITAGAMAGTITNYAESLRARVALLKGMDASSLDTVYAGMQCNPGVTTLLAKAHALGLKTFITSSGFTAITDRKAKELGMTGTCANVIDIVDGKYTGKVSGPAFAPFNGTILDAEGKLSFVESTMASMGLTPEQALCFGDGSNDIKMIDAAGIGVGFRPKAILRPHCDFTLDVMGFDAVLNLFEDTDVFASHH